MELVCPAGNLPSLKLAVDNGANAIYMGFRDETNARHFPGLNFNDKRLLEGVRYAHSKNARVFLAINTYPQPAGWHHWQEAVEKAADFGIDALICADIGVMKYAQQVIPDINLHLSVQGSATSSEAIRYYYEHFGIKRAVLPRVLSMKQLKRVIASSPVDIEVFGFGSLCVMVEGRCFLSSYVTGQSPNTYGACSPASAVRWDETDDGLKSRLNNILIDQYGKNEKASYPTLCKGRFKVSGKTGYAIEEPVSLNTLALLPELKEIGVKAIKIEGRQRSPAYVEKVTQVWRQAIDACHHNSNFVAKDEWLDALSTISEGAQTTFGAYHRPWQ